MLHTSYRKQNQHYSLSDSQKKSLQSFHQSGNEWYLLLRIKTKKIGPKEFAWQNLILIIC